MGEQMTFADILLPWVEVANKLQKKPPDPVGVACCQACRR